MRNDTGMREVSGKGTSVRARDRSTVALRPLVHTREQLLHLLAEAAEFEHNLLCCYLYAAFSLKREADPQLPEGDVALVSGWRKLILSVAMEEMAHLALVSNLMIAIGGRPHFNRPNFPVAPGYHPAGVVVALTPFDTETLDHFIYLERPEDVEVADAASFVPEVEYVRETGAIDPPLMPRAHDYETIAEFYECIRSGFVQLSASMGEAKLFTGGAAGQVGPDIAAIPGLMLTPDLQSALTAINTIIVQGEGSSSRSDDSHFARFLQIKEEYRSCLERFPGFVPARAAARNPVMRRPQDPSDRVFIDAHPAAEVLDLANALYNHMLRLLAQAYGRANPTVAAKQSLISAAIDCMHVLGPVCEHLTTLPATAAQEGVMAGASFAMLRATEPLLENSSEWQLIAERFHELAAGARKWCLSAKGLSQGIEALEKQARLFAAIEP